MIDHDWSLKSLHRLILTSKTYALASTDIAANLKLDPENRYFWRGNRRRLDAEQLRDSILTFSGQLDRTPGGPHPFPHRLTYFFRQHEPYIGDFASNRRTVFLFRQRIRKNRYLDMFDAPDGNLHVGNRRPTTTTLQSLYFMNSKFMADQAQFIAGRAVATKNSPESQIQWLYTHLFGREPSDIELDTLTANLIQLQQQLGEKSIDRPETALSSVVKAMLASNEFLFIE